MKKAVVLNYFKKNKNTEYFDIRFGSIEIYLKKHYNKIVGITINNHLIINFTQQDIIDIIEKEMKQIKMQTLYMQNEPDIETEYDYAKKMLIIRSFGKI